MATSKSGGMHYALTAVGIGMLVLGIIMAVWNLAPGFGSNEKPPPPPPGNSSKPEQNDDGTVKSKTFSVAYVLVGSGIVLLLLAVCLTVREKKKKRNEHDSRDIQEVSALPREQDNEPEEDDDDAPRYGIPSYDEVMGPEFSSTERIDFDRNARISMSLPSYESLNELDDNMPTTVSPKGSLHERQPSGKKVKPLKVRRIKSEKLHLKDFRLNLTNTNNVPPKIEPLTPPPQYDGKTVESVLPAETATLRS